jgi:DNA-binding protein HU-beta
MATLRKSDITARVATRLGGSRAHGEAALSAVLGSIQSALESGDRVVLTGFGSFSLRSVKARRVKPIRGGAGLIEVAAHTRVGFTAGAELNQAVR